MLTSLAYVFLLGMLLGWVFSRIGLPGLLGMLVTGILLGPCVLNLLDPALLGISADPAAARADHHPDKGWTVAEYRGFETRGAAARYVLCAGLL